MLWPKQRILAGALVAILTMFASASAAAAADGGQFGDESPDPDVFAGVNTDGVTIGVSDGVDGTGTDGGQPEYDPYTYVCPSLELRYPCVTVNHVDDGITLRDIQRFLTDPGLARMEPGEWTVVGLPTNFYAIAPVQNQRRDLLGRPADVRFIPVRYHWEYGDGRTATHRVAGATWKAQGKPEFSSTPTSHVYQRSGSYTIRLWIDYAAAFRWNGSDWTVLDGVIRKRANDLHTVATGADTVLVDQHCGTNPAGPGC